MSCNEATFVLACTKTNLLHVGRIFQFQVIVFIWKYYRLSFEKLYQPGPDLLGCQNNVRKPGLKSQVNLTCNEKNRTNLIRTAGRIRTSKLLYPILLKNLLILPCSLPLLFCCSENQLQINVNALFCRIS